MMALSELMDPVTIWKSFPPLTEHQIAWGELLELIEDVLSGSTDILLIEGREEGKEGIGKTTLLAQFALKNQGDCVGLFIDKSCRATYDPWMMQLDLANQVSWLIHDRELEASDWTDERFFRNAVFDLERFARRRKRITYFIVDGLEELEPDDLAGCQQVLQMFQVKHPYLRFLMTGSRDILPKEIRNVATIRSHIMSGFSYGETCEYLCGLGLTNQHIEHLYRASGGNPGYLATARRIFEDYQKDGKCDDMGVLTGKLHALFDIEWHRVDDSDEALMGALAVLAHDRRQYSLVDLSRLLNVNPRDLERSLRQLTFISFANDKNVVRYVSNEYRDFAARKLRYLRQDINRMIIDDLMNRADEHASLDELPIYLDKMGKYREVLTSLEPERMTRIIAVQNSIAHIRRPIQLGIKAASNLNNTGELIRFTMQHCIMEDISRIRNSPAEIDCLIATQNYSGAMALASSQVLIEDRLHMLAIVARAFSKQNMKVPADLQEQIRSLYHQVDINMMGSRSLEIAAALVYSDPKLAFELAEKAADTLDGGFSSDWVFAALSLMAGDFRSASTDQELIRREFTARITDPAALKLSTEASVVFGDWSRDAILAEAARLDNPEDEINLLRLWVKRNHRNPEALEVSRFALDTLVRTTSYAPNAQVFRELAEPLPFSQDYTKVQAFIGSLDTQRPTAERVGPFDEYVRLQLLLAETETKHDIQVARNRMAELYMYVAGQPDVEARAAGFAWMVGHLPDIDPNGYLENLEGLHTLVSEDLEEHVGTILKATAEQFYAMRGIIHALARTSPDRAIEIAGRLNTRLRREAALLEFVDEYLNVADHEFNYDLPLDVLGDLTIPHFRDRAILMILKRIADIENGVSSCSLHLARLVSAIDGMLDSPRRCEAYCLAYTVAHKAADNEQCPTIITHVSDKLNESWESINDEWLKVDVGFQVASSMAYTNDVEAAQIWLEKARQARDKQHVGASSALEDQMLTARLAIRAFAGLIPQRIDEASDRLRIEEIIESIPSPGMQATLWSELALRFHACDRLKEHKEIVARKVRPLLPIVKSCDKAYYVHFLIGLAPALYSAHERSALEEIENLLPVYRDEAYLAICDYIFRKCPHYEPYEESVDSAYDVGFEELIDACALLKLMTGDCAVYSVIAKIGNTAGASKSQRLLTREQKQKIAQEIRMIADEKFPDNNGIIHEGYLIASLAQAARIDPRTRMQDWLDLANRARDIPNIADRVLVLGTIAGAMPNRKNERKQRLKLIEEAVELVSSIPFPLDQADRYEALAHAALGCSGQHSRNLVQKAMGIVGVFDTRPYLAAQRRLISLAYKLDPDMASSLASAFDEDLARAASKRNTSKQLDLLQAMANIASDDAQFAGRDSSSLARFGTMLLASLNAGRSSTIPRDRVNQILKAAHSRPLSKVYPVFAWAIENMIKAYADKPQADSILRPVFEGAISAALFSGAVISRATSGMVSMSNRIASYSAPESIVVRPGERKRAFGFIEDWLSQHVKDYIKIHEPYFGPEDLELLQLITSVCSPECRIHILTSIEHQAIENIERPFRMTYSRSWRTQISDQDPPDCEIMVLGYAGTGKSPIHDRWWVTNGSGLLTGTSLRSLGTDRMSEIRVLSEEEACAREAEIDEYLFRRIRHNNGKKIEYDLFNLS